MQYYVSVSDVIEQQSSCIQIGEHLIDEMSK